MNFPQATIFVFLLALTGCATQEAPQHKWVKSSSSSPEKQFTIDESICLAEAYKAVPESPATDCRFMSDFSAGVCRGAAIRQANNTAALRDKIYDGCMLGKGWKKQLAQ